MIDSRVNTYYVNFSARKRAENLGKIESSHDYDISTLVLEKGKIFGQNSG